MQIVGILIDVPLEQEGSGSRYQDARAITEKAGAAFPNLLMDEGLTEMLEDIFAVPTTCLAGERV